MKNSRMWMSFAERSKRVQGQNSCSNNKNGGKNVLCLSCAHIRCVCSNLHLYLQISASMFEPGIYPSRHLLPAIASPDCQAVHRSKPLWPSCPGIYWGSRRPAVWPGDVQSSTLHHFPALYQVSDWPPQNVQGAPPSGLLPENRQKLM